MNTYKEQELWMIFKEQGNVTVDIVPFDGSEPTNITFYNFEEAKAEIQGYEIANEVYF